MPLLLYLLMPSLVLCPPGRLDKVLYVPLPPPEGRASILVALTRRTPLAPGVELGAVGRSERCSGFSGADLAALVREACVIALKEEMAAQREAAQQQQGEGTVSEPQAPGLQVHMRHFEAALGRVSPSVSRKDARVYEALRRSLRGNTLAPTAAAAAR
jgi:ribosome biogenesis ATPase